jgi:flagellar motor protein MotB
MRHPRHAADEEGEGYFASVSDLMVGILFVFLLMLTVFALNYRQAEQEQLVQRSLYERLAAELQQQKAETERQTAEAEKQRQEADRQRSEAETQKKQNEVLRGQLTEALRLLEQDLQLREQARQSLLLTLGQQLHDRGVLVEVDERSGVLHLSGDLLFATGSAALSADALRTVRVLADVLQATLPCYAADQSTAACPVGAVPVLETVLIEGHTDHRAINAYARYRDNDQLATERALAVFAEMRKDQPALDTIRNRDGLQLLGEAGYGDRRPLPDALGTSEDDFRKNRRIDIRFVLTSRTSDELKRLRAHILDAIGTP